MRPAFSIPVSAFVLAAVIAPASAVAAEKGWTVKSSMQEAVADFRQNAPEIFDMRLYGVPNEPIYLEDNNKGPLLPVYDFLACTKLSHPDGELKVDSGGGFDIEVDKIKFPKGVWPVEVRIAEVEKVRLNEKISVNVLKLVRIGTLFIDDVAVQIQAVRHMAKDCLGD